MWLVCSRVSACVCRMTYHTTGADYTCVTFKIPLLPRKHHHFSLQPWILSAQTQSAAENRGPVVNMPSATATQCLKNYMVQQSVCDLNYRRASMFLWFGKVFQSFVKRSFSCNLSHWRVPDIARGAQPTEWPLVHNRQKTQPASPNTISLFLPEFLNHDWGTDVTPHRWEIINYSRNVIGIMTYSRSTCFFFAPLTLL